MSYFEDQEELHPDDCDGAPNCHLCQATEDYKRDEAQKAKAKPGTKKKGK